MIIFLAVIAGAVLIVAYVRKNKAGMSSDISSEDVSEESEDSGAKKSRKK